VVAKAYFGGADADADAAVAYVLTRAGRPARPAKDLLEVGANRIGLLVQACDATGDLIDLVDHLAEMEVRLAREETQPDRWHASAATTEADLAPFTQADLDEARSRLTRLTRIWVNRLGGLTPEQLDHSPGSGWTVRQLAFHLAGSAYYADAVGDLAPTRQRRHDQPTPVIGRW
jgi:hypothetical protein